MSEELSRKIRALGFFLIIMVTYIHSNTSIVRFSSDATIHNSSVFHDSVIAFVAGGVCAAAVPLFFSISGYLFFYNFVPSPAAYAVKFKRRIFTLVLPYISWSILGLVIFFVLQSVPFSKKFFTHTFVRDLSLRQIFEAIFINPVPNQLWFIRNLILYTLITPVIYLVLKRAPAVPMFLMMAAALLLKRQQDETDIIFYLLFYVLGCFIAIKEIDPDSFSSRNASIAVLALWLIFLMIKSYLIVVHRNYTFLLDNASLIFGIVALWWNYDLIIKWIENSRVFWATSFTFFIYAAHQPLMTIYKKVLVYGLKSHAHIGIVIYFITPILTVATLLVAGNIFKRYFAGAYNFLVGGRG